MNKIEKIKDKILTALEGIDIDKLNMGELHTYAMIAETVSRISSKDYYTEMMNKLTDTSTSYRAPTISDMKE